MAALTESRMPGEDATVSRRARFPGENERHQRQHQKIVLAELNPSCGMRSDLNSGKRSDPNVDGYCIRSAELEGVEHLGHEEHGTERR